MNLSVDVQALIVAFIPALNTTAEFATHVNKCVDDQSVSVHAVDTRAQEEIT